MPITEQDLNHIIAHTQALWHNISNKKIFITGGTGFLGKWLLESFTWANKKLKLNAEMVVLSRNPDSFKAQYPQLSNQETIRFHQGDVRNFNFPQENFDFIIHGATEASAQLNAEKPLLMIDTIIKGTRKTLEFARCCKAKRLLLISSGAVYGTQPSDLPAIPEDYSGAPDPAEPISAYAEGKRLAELLCSIYQKQHDVEATIARCFAFVGPYLNLDIHFAIGNFIRDGLQGRAINVLGDGTPYRSYLYAADMAIWLWTILLQGQPDRAYNVGSDQEISISDLAKKVSGCFANRPEVKIAKTPVSDQRPQRYVPCTKRARDELGLQCWIGLNEAIKRTIQFYQSQ